MSSDGVSAGKLLDLRFGPCSTVFCLARGNDAGAAKHGKFGRMTIAPRCSECVHRRGAGIIAHHAGYCIDEDGLAVSTGAVDEDQGLLAHNTSQAVSAPLLKEVNQLAVIAG